MDVLSSRILLQRAEPAPSQAFYRDVLGLAVHREFPSGLVFFLGGGLLEVSGHPGATGEPALWLQVRDVEAEHSRLRAAGVRVLRPPVREPWGLVELWIEDPEGLRIAVVEVPEDHPLRRDPR